MIPLKEICNCYGILEKPQKGGKNGNLWVKNMLKTCFFRTQKLKSGGESTDTLDRK
jgi:hypothetical protein